MPDEKLRRNSYRVNIKQSTSVEPFDAD